jgi:hypothetical protein
VLLILRLNKTTSARAISMSAEAAACQDSEYAQTRRIEQERTAKAKAAQDRASVDLAWLGTFSFAYAPSLLT